MGELRTCLSTSGFALVPRLIPEGELEPLRVECDRILAASAQRGGARNVLGRSAPLRALATGGAPARLAREMLGADARAVQLTIFDKTEHANWKVGWHQDRTIAVRERREVEGFGPWSVKEGRHHVQPPLEVLEQMLAIRVDLDPASEANGALRVLGATHILGHLDDEVLEAITEGRKGWTCEVPAGGAVLMRPLLLHASRAGRSPSRRRTLHIDYTAGSLPGGLEWL